MSACKSKGCNYEAVMGEEVCTYHKPKTVASTDPNADVLIVEVSKIPKSGRFNEAASRLVAALKVLSEGRALQIKLAKVPKMTITCAQRYALEEGLRVGVRFCGESGYMWKYSAEEMKAAEVKSERLKSARSKKKIKGRAVAA